MEMDITYPPEAGDRNTNQYVAKARKTLPENAFPTGYGFVARIVSGFLCKSPCAGISLPPDRLQQVRAEQNPERDYQRIAVVSQGGLAGSWKAVNQAVAQGVRRLAANQIFPPKPRDPARDTGPGNRHDCPPDGLLLATESVRGPRKEAQSILSEGHPDSGATEADPIPDDATPKSQSEGAQRGTILHFDGQNGIISSNGQQYEFALSHWRGDQPPSARQTVEFQRVGSTAQQVTPLSPADLLREKALQIGEYARQIGRESYARAGRSVTIAYGLFALCALFADTIRNIPVTLAGLINGFSLGNVIFGEGFGNGGFGLFLVLVAILSITTPVFWNQRIAWLAYLAPLVVTLMGWYNLLSEFHAISRYVGFFDHQYNAHLARLITLWLYLTLLAGLYLAGVGVLRYRRHLPIPPSRIFRGFPFSQS